MVMGVWSSICRASPLPPLFISKNSPTKNFSGWLRHNPRLSFPSTTRNSSYYSPQVTSSDSRRTSLGGDFAYRDDDDDSEAEDEDRSLDLLVRFVQNVFWKISKRARKAVRSVLPLSISTQLVGFSVNGVIILAFLWVLKAFLEVVCTFGSLVFVSILLIRGVWSGISYLQESRTRTANDFDDGAWTGAQPAS